MLVYQRVEPTKNGRFRNFRTVRAPNSCSDLRFDEAPSTKEEAKEALTLDQWLRQMVGDQKTIENTYVMFHPNPLVDHDISHEQWPFLKGGMRHFQTQ